MDQGCLDKTYSHFSQKRLKPTNYCLETVNSFVSVSMVKIYHNPMHLTDYISQSWIRGVQTTLIPIFSQKRLKPTKICLEAINSFNSVFMVKMYHNPMHLTDYISQRLIRGVQTTLIPISPKKATTNKLLLRNCKQLCQCFDGQNMSQFNAFD